MTWSPSAPPKDRKFIAQDEHGNVGEARWNNFLKEYGWTDGPNFQPKFWQDFPKAKEPRDHYGAKIRQRSL